MIPIVVKTQILSLVGSIMSLRLSLISQYGTLPLVLGQALPVIIILLSLF